jgi:hypothetical protein
VGYQKLFDIPRGFPEVKNTLNDDGTATETETQPLETHFQVSALLIENPEDLSRPTASDVANFMAMWLASRAVSRVLRQHAVNLLRVTLVRNPYFSDDKNREEAMPNFDLVLTHTRVLSSTVPAADQVVPYGGQLYPV